MDLAEKAREFAVIAHAGQIFGPSEPYMVHLDAVADLVGDDEIAQAIAYLHDVVEDTPATIRDVESHFGWLVAQCVALVTDCPGRTRKDRKAATHSKLASIANPDYYPALLVKTADRCANVEMCVQKGNTGLLQMYRKEQESFRAAAYRPGLCEHLWLRIEAALKGAR